MYCLDIDDIIGLELHDYINEVELRIFTKISNQDVIYVSLYKWDDTTLNKIMRKNKKVRKEFSECFFEKIEPFQIYNI